MNKLWLRERKQSAQSSTSTGQRSGLLLLLSHFSRVRLCATPETAAHQAPPSLGFSRQEHWSGLPFPSLMCESEVAQSCPTLSDPMDCSLPGSSIHGIFQARVLEWGAIVNKMQGLTLSHLAPLAPARGLLSGGWISQLLATSLSCAVGVFEEAGQSRIPWAWASVVLHP